MGVGVSAAAERGLLVGGKVGCHAVPVCVCVCVCVRV